MENEDQNVTLNANGVDTGSGQLIGSSDNNTNINLITTNDNLNTNLNENATEQEPPPTYNLTMEDAVTQIEIEQ